MTKQSLMKFKNGYDQGRLDTVIQVLEIIDSKRNFPNDRNMDAWERGFWDCLDEMESAVQALQEEQGCT